MSTAEKLSGGTATITDERVEYSTDNGDHERFSHYAEKDKITEALVLGTPVTALCGKVWVPSRDPERFPVCPECKDIWESLNDGDEGDPSGDA